MYANRWKDRLAFVSTFYWYFWYFRHFYVSRWFLTQLHMVDAFHLPLITRTDYNISDVYSESTWCFDIINNKRIKRQMSTTTLKVTSQKEKHYTNVITAYRRKDESNQHHLKSYSACTCIPFSMKIFTSNNALLKRLKLILNISINIDVIFYAFFYSETWKKRNERDDAKTTYS